MTAGATGTSLSNAASAHTRMRSVCTSTGWFARGMRVIRILCPSAKLTGIETLTTMFSDEFEVVVWTTPSRVAPKRLSVTSCITTKRRQTFIADADHRSLLGCSRRQAWNVEWSCVWVHLLNGNLYLFVANLEYCVCRPGNTSGIPFLV